MVILEDVARALAADIDPDDAEPEFLALYEAEAAPFDGIFAVIHRDLNGHFRFMNQKMKAGRHFNAEDSRQLSALIDQLGGIRKSLKRVGVVFELREDYRQTIENCKAFLVHSGGSTIPDWMEPVEIERFEPVMLTSDRAPSRKSAASPPMTLVGEGSFAVVHKYVDPLYQTTMAVKRAKVNLDEREIQRFRAEFDLMREIRFPYIVEAYAYDESRNSFTMEYCDETLGEYIRRENANISWSTRKRIALQFLYGLNYLHLRGALHRDISRSNVLVKRYDMGAVLVKLSDFGLHKSRDSEFTRVDTELKGSILDPTLESFKNFAATNDIYAAGVLLSFIFTGRTNLGGATGPIGAVVAKATDSDTSRRYGSVSELIVAVEALEPSGSQSASATV